MSHERQSELSVSHTHPLRRVQSAFQGFTPVIVDCLYRTGWLDGTAVATVKSQGETVLPDDLTLAALQLTIESANSLVETGSYKSMGKTALGGLLDALDGMLARHLKMASPDGAVNDVIADRIGDNYMAWLIAKHRSRYAGSMPDLEEQLRVSFNLSAMTKAASAMAGVPTREGGPGSMLERRRILLGILHNLGELNRKPNLRESSKQKLLSEIDSTTEFLISSSRQRARRRTEDMVIEPSFLEHGLLGNPSLRDPKSGAAVEARKYAAIAFMNQRTGLDIVGQMNALIGHEIFPPAEDLVQSHGYIRDTLENTEPFLQKALSLARKNEEPSS